MTSLNLVPRAGQMIINFGISSSGDDARTVDIPFGTLATEGGSAKIPKALKLSIQSSSGVPIGGSNVVCQAFKDAQGTQVLGKSFTQSTASTLGPEPVTIGSIFCSDAKGVSARVGGDGASGQSSSTGSDVATTAEAQSTSSTVKMGASSAPAMQSAASTASSLATSKHPIALSTAASATDPPSSSAAASSSNAASTQSTSAASSVHTHNIWTVKKFIKLSILAVCYTGWFMI